MIDNVNILSYHSDNIYKKDLGDFVCSSLMNSGSDVIV